MTDSALSKPLLAGIYVSYVNGLNALNAVTTSCVASNVRSITESICLRQIEIPAAISWDCPMKQADRNTKLATKTCSLVGYQALSSTNTTLSLGEDLNCAAMKKAVSMSIQTTILEP